MVEMTDAERTFMKSAKRSQYSCGMALVEDNCALSDNPPPQQMIVNREVYNAFLFGWLQTNTWSCILSYLASRRPNSSVQDVLIVMETQVTHCSRR